MNFEEYQHLSRKTAVYPLEYKIIYPTLGLAGETGEVVEKIKKLIRDKDFKMTPEYKDSIKKEMGDVLWYIANLATDLDLNMSEIAADNIEKLFDRKERNAIRGDGDKR